MSNGLTYLCRPEPQGDGSAFQWLNCGCASITENIDLSSCGRLRWESHICRRVSRDTSGGIEGGVLARLGTSFSGLKFEYRRIVDRDEVIDLAEVRNLSIMIDCVVTVRTIYRTGSFTGLHWTQWAAHSFRAGDRTVYREDPGTTSAGWHRMPVKLLLEAAFSVGNNGYWVMVGPKVVDVDLKVIVGQVVIRERPSRDAQKIGLLRRGDEVHALRTATGGPWLRANGSQSRGWWVIRHRGGKGFIRGEAAMQLGQA